MTDEELKAKVEELGRITRELEDKQLAFDMENQALSMRIFDLKAELREIFLARKDGMQTVMMTVQYRKGAVKWDTKWLDGFAIDHPEYNLGQYRKVGKPTVAFVPKGDAPWDEGM